ncbi:MAG: methionyl-tRNA formyltransferase [Woeseiaceae bacterium]
MTRIVFAGTPDFALASLRALVEAGHVPVAVLTQPDRPAGRGKKLTASPVKRYAVEQGIPVQQPATLRDAQAVRNFAALDPDLLIVAAYGLILPQDVLDVPTHGCLNVHASILPRWRGAAPIQAAILAGDQQTGISLMAMTAGLDCGPVFRSEAIRIGDDETAGELHDRLAALGARTLLDELDNIVAGRLEATPQDDERATYAPKIDKQDARIDWTLAATEIARRIRAYNPFPGAFCFVATEPEPLRLKIWQAAAVTGSAAPGTVLRCDRGAVLVACGEEALSLEELQLPGKRRVASEEFAAQLDLTGKRLD